ncbi:MAG: YqgE/AlgH family protein [Bacteroidales bacterium]|nr:YqgE/AlgH family protein [Bacteroidales bacterium]
MKKEHLKIKHNKITPSTGKILISEPFLSEAWFQRSIILLTDHGEQGSMGFVINKPIDLKVNDFFDELRYIEDITLYCGGPMETNRLFYLHCLGNEIIPDSIYIGNGIYFDGSFEAVKRYLLDGNSAKGVLKFFLGYSGWEKEQLKKEIENDTWLVSSARKSLIFNTESSKMWDKALKRLGPDYFVWSICPLDPTYN